MAAAPRERTVVLTHGRPDWIGPELAAEFDLRQLDFDDPACRTARAMITPGPAKLGAETLDRLPNLELVCTIGSGYEGVDTAHLAGRGIILANSAQATAEDVADHTVAVTLALHGRIPALDAGVRDGGWPRPGFRRSLGEHAVGVVGLGAIGRAVARRLEPFGCRLRWTGPHFHESAHEFVPDLAALAEGSDILIVAARADASNAGLIDAAVLDRLGPEGLIVNVSRGGIIDEDALIAALKAGRLGGAALDVFAQEPTPAGRWRDVPNVVLTPHVGGLTTGVRRKIRELLARNLRAFFEGGELEGVAVPAKG